MTDGPTTFTLPEPPSANRWWRKFQNRMVLSAEARAYKTRVAVMLHAKAQPLTGPVALTLTWYRGRKAGDLDKRVGVLLDGLQGVLYANDAQIVALHAYRFDDKKNPRVEVTVTEVEQ
jgi:crossover junction endodeoxyribonuclease RusA